MGVHVEAWSRWECGEIKARFVAKGSSHVEGIDCEETFAPVALYSSIRTILQLAAQMG